MSMNVKQSPTAFIQKQMCICINLSLAYYLLISIYISMYVCLSVAVLQTLACEEHLKAHVLWKIDVIIIRSVYPRDASIDFIGGATHFFYYMASTYCTRVMFHSLECDVLTSSRSQENKTQHVLH